MNTQRKSFSYTKNKKETINDNSEEEQMNQIKNEELKNDFSIDINIITKDKVEIKIPIKNNKNSRQ